MKKVKADNLYFVFDIKNQIYHFYVGTSNANQLVDLKGFMTVSKSPKACDENRIKIVKVWENFLNIDNDIYAKINWNFPKKAEEYLTEGFATKPDATAEAHAKVFNITTKSYSTDKLHKIERFLNLQMEYYYEKSKDNKSDDFGL